VAVLKSEGKCCCVRIRCLGFVETILGTVSLDVYMRMFSHEKLKGQARFWTLKYFPSIHPRSIS
jgi:hypothetical protein